jgi:hypothetical protein
MTQQSAMMPQQSMMMPQQSMMMQNPMMPHSMMYPPQGIPPFCMFVIKVEYNFLSLLLGGRPSLNPNFAALCMAFMTNNNN